MLIADIKRVIDQVSREKGIEVQALLKAVEEALKSAARKKYGNRIDIEVRYNEELGEVEVFQFKEVAAEITDPDIQISLQDGLALDPECEIGDSLGEKMDAASFGRIAAQSAKQVIIQKMKDAERDAIYNSFIERKGEIINGIVQRVERGSIIVSLAHTEAILTEREQTDKEVFRRGDRIRAYITDVRHDARGPQIFLSRTHPNFIINLFKAEVPEISEGIVTIMGAVREPGSRAKIAVASNDSDIDPVGACVGIKGSRVQNVVQELRGEKIDIIPWHIDSARFVCNALAPAEISRVVIDESNRLMEVIVPDEYLSVAIGKRGQNVRLASKLTKWRLDVKSETNYAEEMRIGMDSLLRIPEMTEQLAKDLHQKGYFSAEELASGRVADLVEMDGMTEEKATDLILRARRTAFNEYDTTAEVGLSPKSEPNSEDHRGAADKESESEMRGLDGEDQGV